MTMLSLTVKRLKELLHYDPKTGLFTWINSRGKRGRMRGFAGCVRRSNGYVQIEINEVIYLAHRLAFLYMTGKMPKHDTDHKDGNRANNIWSNLRSVTRMVNLQNTRKAATNNALGILGVCAERNGFKAQIKVNKENVYLGLFPTPELAHAAYIKAKRKYHPGCMI
jgi:hypothetical protein